MIRQFPDYLRLHTEEPAVGTIVRDEPCGALDRLCESFRSATGWSLRHGKGAAPLQSPDVLWARTLSRDADRPSHLAIYRSAGKTPHDLQNELLPLCDLIDSMADLIGGYYDTQQALIEREAELATSVPLVSHSTEEMHLSQTLEAILRGGAEAIDAQAAGLYLLDDATSQLKLRARWGLPDDRFLQPARQLSGAFADLEALTGHAVTIEDAALLPHWKVPEPFSSALCVPISSPTTPLGTLWLFGQQVREFSPSETQLAEIIAGRVAAELERHILLSEVTRLRDTASETGKLKQLHDVQLPVGPIATDEWEVAALHHQGRTSGCEFYDWVMNADGSLTAAIAGIHSGDLGAAMTLQLLRGATKTALLQGAAPKLLLRDVADVAWTSTAGEHQASLAILNLPEADGEIEFCSAGPLGALIVRPGRPSAIAQGTPPLGSDPDAVYSAARHSVDEEDAVVLVSDQLRKSLNVQGEQLGEAAIADCVREHLNTDPQRLVEVVFDLWREHAEDPQQPVTILIAKRRRG